MKAILINRKNHTQSCIYRSTGYKNSVNVENLNSNNKASLYLSNKDVENKNYYFEYFDYLVCVEIEREEETDWRSSYFCGELNEEKKAKKKKLYDQWRLSVGLEIEVIWQKENIKTVETYELYKDCVGWMYTEENGHIKSCMYFDYLNNNAKYPKSVTKEMY